MIEKRLNIAEAKKHFSEIVGRVAYGGESVLLMKRGIPLSEIVPLEKTKKHPANVNGWMDEDDDFFKDIKSFRKQIPRVLRKGK